MSRVRQRVIIKKNGYTLAEVVRPQKPYESLEEFRREGFLLCEPQRSDSNFWPCTLCNGKGWVYDPDDPPCVVEGNKLRNRLKCQLCKGTSKGSKELVERLYENRMSEFEEADAVFEDDLELFIGAIARLRDEDISILLDWLGKVERNQYSTYKDEVIDI